MTATSGPARNAASGGVMAGKRMVYVSRMSEDFTSQVIERFYHKVLSDYCHYSYSISLNYSSTQVATGCCITFPLGKPFPSISHI